MSGRGVRGRVPLSFLPRDRARDANARDPCARRLSSGPYRTARRRASAREQL